jgi:outer membrane protein TolC
MHWLDRRLAAAWCTLACAAACTAVVDPAPDFERARAAVGVAAPGVPVHDPGAAPMSEAQIDEKLRDGLALEEALELALTNNRRLQAGFMELGVGHADLVQAGLISNPNLSVALLLPSGGGRERIGLDVMQSIAELWSLRARKHTARLEQDARILELSRAAAELVVEVKGAYFDGVAALAERDASRSALELARETAAGVRRRFDVGVATRTELAAADADVRSAEFAEQLTRFEQIASRQRLATLLGLQRDLDAVNLLTALPGDVALDGSDEAWVARAHATRLDVQGALKAVERARAALDMERGQRVRRASLGLTSEQPEVGSNTSFVAGVAGSVEVPVFDTNQAQIRRAEYALAALDLEHAALRAEVDAQVRAALRRAQAAREALNSAERDLAPACALGVELARRSLELGDATVLELLDARRRLAQAQRDTVRARRELASAGLELERCLGAPLQRFAGNSRADAARD